MGDVDHGLCAQWEALCAFVSGLGDRQQ